MTTIIVIVLVAFFALAIVQGILQGQKRDEVDASFRGLPGFRPSQVLSSPTKGLALDQVSKQIAIALTVGERLQCRAIPFSAITGVDIEETEGSSVTKKTGFAQFTTGSSLQSLTLSLTLSDQEIPLFRIPLYISDSDKASAWANNARQQAIEQANLWRGLISAVVRTNQLTAANQQAGPPIKVEPVPLSSELESLHRLQQAGVLSKEEFIAAKARLLNRVE